MHAHHVTAHVLRLSAILTAVLLLTLALPVASRAAVMTWNTSLSGSQEIPPAATTATGFGTVQYDDVANTLSLYVEWDGLTGPGVQAHIHCCVPSPPGNVGIAINLWLAADPRAATGTYSASYDLGLVNPFSSAFTTANGGSINGALQALINGMNAGDRAYYNIHTAQFPGGEIRGNLAVPEPSSMLLLLGAVGAVLVRRRSARL